jgi:hypothetical protein
LINCREAKGGKRVRLRWKHTGWLCLVIVMSDGHGDLGILNCRLVMVNG